MARNNFTGNQVCWRYSYTELKFMV
jgi:hypothetical protein